GLLDAIVLNMSKEQTCVCCSARTRVRTSSSKSSEPPGGGDDLVHDAGLGHRMSRIGHDVQGRVRPGLMQLDGAAHRRDDIITPLDDGARNAREAMRIS